MEKLRIGSSRFVENGVRLVTLLSVMASMLSVQAADRFFRPDENAATEGTFNGAGSWRDTDSNVASTPGVADIAYITGFLSQTSATVNFTANAASAELLLFETVDLNIGAFSYSVGGQIYVDNGAQVGIHSGTLNGNQMLVYQGATVTVDAGSTLTLTNTDGGFYTLYANDADITVNGTLNVATSLGIGVDSGSSQMTVSGAGASVVNTGSFIVIGDDSGDVDTIGGNGDLVVENSASFTGDSDTFVALGSANGSTGTMTIRTGGNVTVGSVGVGRDTGSIGSILVTGVGSSLHTIDTEGTDFRVGRDGSGTLTVADSASAESDSNVEIGFSSGSDGIVTVTGSGSTLTVANSIAVGGGVDAAGGTGTLSISAGGSVTADNAVIVYADGQIELDGGSIEATSGGFDLRAGALVSGSGTLTGNVVSNGATYTPGNSPGTLTIAGDWTLDVTDTVVMELEGNGLGESDRIAVQGIIRLNSAQLSLSLLPSFTEMLGDEFILIDNQSAFAIIGEFGGIGEGDTFTLGGTDFIASYSGGDGNDMSFTIVPEPTSGMLLLAGLAMSLAMRRTRKKR